MYTIELREALRTFGEWVSDNAKDDVVLSRYSVPHPFRDFIRLIDEARDDGTLPVIAAHRFKNETALAHMAYRLTGIFRPRVVVIDPARPFDQPAWMTRQMLETYRSYRFLPDLMSALEDRISDPGVLAIFAGQMPSSPAGKKAQEFLARGGVYRKVDEQLKPLKKPLLEALPKLLDVKVVRGTGLESESIFEGLVVDTFLRTMQYLAAGYMSGEQELIELYGGALQDYLLSGVPIYVDGDKALFLKARAR